MSSAALIYPHQLFADHPALDGVASAVLVEEPLLFRQYAFHRQKLLLHRASMQAYAETLRRKVRSVHVVEAHDLDRTEEIGSYLAGKKINKVRYVDPNDDWLSTRLVKGLARHRIAAECLEDPHFLTPESIIDDFTAGRNKLFFTEFYIAQRKRLALLLDSDRKPLGGQWSFDPENRKKLPRGQEVPAIPWCAESSQVAEARRYVRARFPDAIGSDENFGYPIDHASSVRWLEEFIRVRLGSFGDYEDAISIRHDVLFHSVLTPMLTIGLISPRQVLDAALARVEEVPLNSLEGFVRQVAGWREFIRLVYRTRGRRQRSRNFWSYRRAMPRAFYDGTTGIEPVDHVIQRVLRTGYCHHIERLMILGNFMLLCEVDPDEVYRWFMELFVDAYDWVMVPNVYGMSQHADGGFMTTKPYISGSSYVRKMSDFPKGAWCEIWDALYWRFIDQHSEFFSSNPRMAMMVRMKEKLGSKMKHHRKVAEKFLESLV